MVTCVVFHSHGKQTVLRSRTCHRSASDSAYSSLPLGSARAHPWLGRYPRWPGWPPWHWRSHMSPQWSRAGEAETITLTAPRFTEQGDRKVKVKGGNDGNKSTWLAWEILEQHIKVKPPVCGQEAICITQKEAARWQQLVRKLYTQG